MQSRYELFDLATDPGETHDLAMTEAERCADLSRHLREWRRAVGAQEMRPNPAYDPSAPTRLLPPASDGIPMEQQ